MLVIFVLNIIYWSVYIVSFVAMPMLHNQTEVGGKKGKGTAPRRKVCQGHSQVTRASASF